MAKPLLLISGLLVGYWLIVQNDSSVAIPQADGDLVYPGYQFERPEPIELSGRLLSRRDYGSGREAELSPTDFALGWNRLEDPAIAGQIEFTQSNRWYYWRADRLPLPRREIQHSSANVHLIPASEQVRLALERVDVGERVTLKGRLIDVRAEDGWRWRSSRSRTDSGAGSCELLLVDDVSVG